MGSRFECVALAGSGAKLVLVGRDKARLAETAAQVAAACPGGSADSLQLSLDALITHRAPAQDADAAYRTAFNDPACLKMILDWRGTA